MESKALAVIEKATKAGALSFVAQGITDTVPLYKPEATLLEVTPEDFHDLKGKLVAKKETCDKIGDAAGIDFIAESCVVRTELREDDIGKRTVFIGSAQGRTRLPDGSWRRSTVEEYEFDPYLRAKIDAGTKSEESLRLDYMKFGRSRAATGARLRVIRQLTGMPTAFEKAKIGAGKSIVFSRIVQNTDYILATPEGRMMAIAMATGATQMLYGQGGPQLPAPQKEAAPEAPPEPRNVTPDAPPADADIFGDEEALDPREPFREVLRGYVDDFGDKFKAADLEKIKAAAEDEDISLADLQKKVETVHGYLKSHGLLLEEPV